MESEKGVRFSLSVIHALDDSGRLHREQRRKIVPHNNLLLFPIRNARNLYQVEVKDINFAAAVAVHC